MDQLQLDGSREFVDDLVDDVVALHEQLGRFTVSGQQCVRRAGDPLPDQREGLGKQPVNFMGDRNRRPERLFHDERPRHE